MCTNPHIVRVALGHTLTTFVDPSIPTVTARYVHPSIEEIRTAILKMEEITIGALTTPKAQQIQQAKGPDLTSENYLSIIEAEWMRLQGGAVRLSPLEWAFADSWEEAGIPIQAVITGMRASFTSFKPAHPGLRIHSLQYCYQAIMTAWEQIAPELYWQNQRKERDLYT